MRLGRRAQLVLLDAAEVVSFVVQVVVVLALVALPLAYLLFWLGLLP